MAVEFGPVARAEEPAAIAFESVAAELVPIASVLRSAADAFRPMAMDRVAEARFPLLAF